MMHSFPSSSLRVHFQRVPIERIDFPDHFTSGLYPGVDASLCDQVRIFGLQQPLPVQQRAENSYHLLAGYAYLPVLRHLESQTVHCQIIDEDFSSLSLYALQILHGLSTVTTSPILQAHLLREAGHTLSATEILLLLPLMGHKPQPYKIEELVALLDLAPIAILALHQGHVAPKTGKLLSRLPLQDQQYLVELILRYRPGGSKQQKLIELLTELSLRHNAPLASLTQPWMDKQQEDPVNLPQQLQALLRFLHEQCFPHLTDAEKRFQQFIEELVLPPQVRLDHSPSFEDESVELTIRFPDHASLKQSWPILSHIPSCRDDQ